MDTIEKYGGYWIDDTGSGFKLIHESYDEKSDLLAAVFFRAPNTYRVRCFEKKRDFDYVGLWWTERRPDAIFSQESEAVAFAEKRLSTGLMVREISEIVSDIEAFAPTHDQWRPLDNLFAELWQHDFPTDVIPALFRVFERFPNEDGAGVLWSIVHGLEKRNDYENALRQSLARAPSFMGKVMLDRLERSQTKPTK